LAEAFAREAARRFGVEGVTLDGDLLAALARRDYPGNVRELENVITRLVALSSGGAIGLSDLEEPEAKASPKTGSFREQVEELERSLLTRSLTAADGNQSEAARQLGLSRATFLDKLKRYGLG
jgi:two-component system, NtrC family, response regulator AtoC